MDMETIPVINLGNLTNFPTEHIPHEYSVWKCLGICGEFGIMYLVNHGIPNDVIIDVFEQSQKFFSLSQDSKDKYQKPKNIHIFDSYFGYNNPDGQAVFEFRETYDWIEGRGVYPDAELPAFRHKINTLHEHCKHLAKKILRLWAIGLGLKDVDFFIKKHQHWLDIEKFTGLTNIRLAHYPRISGDIKIPEKSVRINEHTDFISLTLLFQDNVGGLEAKNVNGNWIPVHPRPGAIVLNTGDLLEFWTSGLFPATPHRVLIPDSEDKKRVPRYSVAYFSGPDTTETIIPLLIEKTPKEQARMALCLNCLKEYSSEPIIAQEHVMNKIKKLYDTAYLQE